MFEKERNVAFIDGQNLYLGIKEQGWVIDHYRFHIYLRDRYKVVRAYYFLGIFKETERNLYENLRKSGYTLCFKEHSPFSRSIKRGNVDTDIVFQIMSTIINDPKVKIIIVSGDGDYKKLVDFLVAKEKLKRILFPNKEFASRLYRDLQKIHFDYLSEPGIKAKIEYK